MIDFHCPDCGQALTAPEDASGKMSKCPVCGAVSQIPARPVSEGEEIIVAELADGQVTDPYVMGPRQNPGAEEKPRERVPIVPSSVDPIRAFAVAWYVWKRNVVAMTMAVFAQWALTILVVGIAAVGNTIMLNITADAAEPFSIVIAILRGLTQGVLNVYLTAGLLTMTVDSVRGRTVSFWRVFCEGRHFFRLFAAGLLCALLLLSGTLMLIIPGLIVAFAIGPWFQFFVIDRNAGAIRSIQAAWLVGKDNIGPVLGLCLFSILISLVGLAACVVGIFVAAPLVLQLWAAAYLQAIGQPSDALGPDTN